MIVRKRRTHKATKMGRSDKRATETTEFGNAE